MSRTVEEIRQYLLDNYDPDDLTQLFELTSEEILDRFEDKVLYYSSSIEEAIEYEAGVMGYEPEPDDFEG